MPKHREKQSDMSIREHKYTVEEIDRMRFCLSREPVEKVRYRYIGYGGGSEDGYHGVYLSFDPVPNAEERLRTHMMNGTSPAELEARYYKKVDEVNRWIAEHKEWERQRAANESLRKLFHAEA